MTLSRRSRESPFRVCSISRTASLFSSTQTRLAGMVPGGALADWGCSLMVTSQSPRTAPAEQAVSEQSCTPKVSLVVSASRLTTRTFWASPRTVLVSVVMSPAATWKLMRPLRPRSNTSLLAPGATFSSTLPLRLRTVTFRSLD